MQINLSCKIIFMVFKFILWRSLKQPRFGRYFFFYELQGRHAEYRPFCVRIVTLHWWYVRIVTLQLWYSCIRYIGVSNSGHVCIHVFYRCHWRNCRSLIFSELIWCGISRLFPSALESNLIFKNFVQSFNLLTITTLTISNFALNIFYKLLNYSITPVNLLIVHKVYTTGEQ